MAVKKLKVLFFGEGATLAHVARPLMLAEGLDANQFEVVLCRPPGYASLTTGLPFPVLDLACQDASIFADHLEHGRPLYDFATLSRYVETDLGLIDQEAPDIIVGDFRLSLAVSARLRSTPYITICDAYWSPERALSPRLPVFGFTRFIPIPLMDFLFRQISPMAFKLHARPIERLRAKFGLPSLGHDLRCCYTDADLRLFANFPALFPEIRPHLGADFLGPISWSPPPSAEQTALNNDERPLVYVTMGSSGSARVTEAIIPVLEKKGVRIIVSTAGKPLKIAPKKSSTQVFSFFPGAVACKQADLIICNGGSPTTNQALINGKPVLGICQNMDQLLNMEAIESYGAGIQLRSDRTNPSRIDAALSTLLGDPKYSFHARQLANTLPKQTFHEILGQHLVRLYGRSTASLAQP